MHRMMDQFIIFLAVILSCIIHSPLIFHPRGSSVIFKLANIINRRNQPPERKKEIQQSVTSFLIFNFIN
jgi:hypothetical protein